MSFGRRLRLFFAGIVVLPMIVLAVLVVQVSRDSRDGKADARLAAGLDTARAFYNDALRSAPDEAKRIAGEAGADLAAGDAAALRTIAKREVADPAVAAVTFTAADGEVLASAGPVDAIARGRSTVSPAGGGAPAGTVRVAALAPKAFLNRVKELTSRQGALVSDAGTLASTADVDEEELPDGSKAGAVSFQLPSGEGRAAALDLAGAPAGTSLVLFTPVETAIAASEPAVLALLAAFFVLAFVLLALLVRDLQRRIATMLIAARQIGAGNFDHRVPAEGDDEMAGLAREMNRMSDRLSAQVGELERQRAELDQSIGRIGEAFASGLDRRALLELLVETAVSACGAEGGRVVLGAEGELEAATPPPEHLDRTLRGAADEAWATRQNGSASENGCHALARAMVGRPAQGKGGEVLCVLAVARRGDEFTDRDREVLDYLIGQTTTSIENIELHERVSEQAKIDALTGIPNKRHFDEWLDHEVARVERFGGELSLILLDIDDFKRVNDTFGHQRGDRVLERIGAVLREQSRDVDLAGRYGGEEFVLALPETSGAGAMEAAGRLRVEIERATADRSNGEGSVAVTASVGVGIMPADGNDARALIAAADRALYEAKRQGKNRVVASAGASVTLAQGKPPPRRN